MIQRVPICFGAIVLVAAAYPAAARPVRKAASPARRPAAATVPHEVLADGVCRYTVSQGGEPQDEVRFLFHSVELALPRHGAVTPVVAERDYRADQPEGAPESERRVYAHEVGGEGEQALEAPDRRGQRPLQGFLRRAGLPREARDVSIVAAPVPSEGRPLPREARGESIVTARVPREAWRLPREASLLPREACGVSIVTAGTPAM